MIHILNITTQNLVFNPYHFIYLETMTHASLFGTDKPCKLSRQIQYLQRIATNDFGKKKKKVENAKGEPCKPKLKQGITPGNIVELMVKSHRYPLIVLLEKTREHLGQVKKKKFVRTICKATILRVGQKQICFHIYYFDNCIYLTNSHLSNLCPYCPKSFANKCQNLQI